MIPAATNLVKGNGVFCPHKHEEVVEATHFEVLGHLYLDVIDTNFLCFSLYSSVF